MKKLILMAAIAVFGFTNGHAQNVSFGVKAGMNISTIGGDYGNYYDYLDGDAEDNIKSKIGFHIGGLAEIMINEKFAVQPELLFSSQGYKSEYNFGGVMEESTVNLSYINLPVMAKFFPIANLAIEAGPQVGFLVSAKNDYEFSDADFPEDNESGDKDVKDYFKGIDFGLNFGASYKMDSGLFFSARYNLGLSEVDDLDIYNNDEDFEDIYNDYAYSRKNRVFQLSVGFMF